MFDTTDPEALERTLAPVLDAQVAFAVVACAVELGVFDALTEALSASVLAERIRATPDGAERLACALVSLGLLERTPDAKFRGKDSTRAVLGDGSSLSATLRFRGGMLAPLLARLSLAVRTGRPQHAGWPFVGSTVAQYPYDELAKHADAYRTFLAAMDVDARGVGTALAEALQLERGLVVADAGCGGGEVARELLTQVPGLVVHSFDLAPAVAVARSRGVADGHRIEVGDLREPWPVRGVDVALLSAVLADFDRSTQTTILRHARQALKRSGRLVVSEQLLGDDGVSPGGTPLLSLVLLAGTSGGRQLRHSELRALVEGVGLVIERLDRAGPRDVCVARLA